MAVRKPKAPIGRVKGEKLADELRAYYLRGRQIEEYAKKAKKPKQGKVSSKELMQLFGVSAQQLAKTRAFARCYTETELDELCDTRNPDTESPLHWAHVIQLLVLKDKRKRRKLQKDAARHGWGVRTLQHEVRKARGKDAESGGRPHKYSTKDATVADIQRWGAEVQRYLLGLLRKAVDDAGTELLVVQRAMANQDKQSVSALADSMKHIMQAASAVEHRLREIAEAGSIKKKRMRKKK